MNRMSAHYKHVGTLTVTLKSCPRNSKHLDTTVLLGLFLPVNFFTLGFGHGSLAKFLCIKHAVRWKRTHVRTRSTIFSSLAISVHQQVVCFMRALACCMVSQGQGCFFFFWECRVYICREQKKKRGPPNCVSAPAAKWLTRVSCCTACRRFSWFRYLHRKKNKNLLRWKTLM